MGSLVDTWRASDPETTCKIEIAHTSMGRKRKHSPPSSYWVPPKRLPIAVAAILHSAAVWIVMLLLQLAPTRQSSQTL